MGIWTQDHNGEITDGPIKRDTVTVMVAFLVGFYHLVVSLSLVCLSSNSACASLQSNAPETLRYLTAPQDPAPSPPGRATNPSDGAGWLKPSWTLLLSLALWLHLSDSIYHLYCTLGNIKKHMSMIQLDIPSERQKDGKKEEKDSGPGSNSVFQKSPCCDCVPGRVIWVLCSGPCRSHELFSLHDGPQVRPLLSPLSLDQGKILCDQAGSLIMPHTSL